KQAQLARRIGQRAIERQSALVSAPRLRHLSLELQNMPELQMRVGVFRLVSDRGAIGALRPGRVAAFLQRMPVLDPDRWIARLGVERHAVETSRELPLPTLAGTVGA